MTKTTLSNQEILSILRDSPAVTQAIENKEIKQKKREMTKRRSELIEQRRSRLNELQNAYTEVEREIMEVKEQLRQIKNRRAGIVMAQISERHRFDMEIGKCEHFLKKHANPEILAQIEHIKNLKDGLPSKLQCWEINDESIISSWPNPFKRRVRYGSNLQEIKGELKKLDCEIGDLKEQILSGE